MTDKNLTERLVTDPIDALDITIEMLHSVVNPSEDVTMFMSDYDLAKEMQEVCKACSDNLENLKAYLQELYDIAEAEYDMENGGTLH